MSRVAVVIPTSGDREMLMNSIRSVLSQTRPPEDVLVVIDGPGDVPKHVPQAITVLRNQLQRGANGARMTGVHHSKADLIAFLDDDDEWAPTYLETQLVHFDDETIHLAACQMFIQASISGHSEVSPRRPPKQGESLSDYLFVRRSLFSGDTSLQTSTIICRRDTVLEVPLDDRLERHQDWDWILRLDQARKRLHFEKMPLVTYRQHTQVSISKKRNWRASLTWAQDRSHLMSRRAYTDFCLVIVAGIASTQGDFRALYQLPRAAGLHLRDLNLLNIALYPAMFALTPRVRNALRRIKHRRES